ncbi:MAG: 2-oxoacid:acceptor oxidoreductase family protein [Bacillota bacterium]
MKRTEYRLAGSGGQGMILAGIILAEAVGVHAGRHVVQTQSYGPESRGGASRAEVVISGEPIDYPKVTRPDVLLCLTQEACRRYARDLAPGGLLIVDSTLVKEVPGVDGRVVSVPIARVAREELGREIVANIVALGVINGLTQVVSPAALETAVLARVPRGTADLNRRALARGTELAQEEQR